MSSSQDYTIEKPCLNEKPVYFSSRDKTLYICLREDKSVVVSELKQGIREYGLNPGDIVDNKVTGFLYELRDSIKKSIKNLLGEDIIDISLPKIKEDKVDPGEFPGNYLLDDSSDLKIVLHVEPKIGWSGYNRMLRDTKRSIDVLVAETGVLEPLLGNLHYPTLSSPVSYGILLLRLTNLILSSSPPRKTNSVKTVSEDIVGHPVLPDTLKYIWQGYPLGVYERVRIEIHDYPYMLLAKFHYDLTHTLKNSIEILLENMKSAYNEFIASGIEWLQRLHWFYLTTPPLNNYFNILSKEEVDVQDLVGETRRASRINPYFTILADLYEMYISNIGLIHEYIERGVIIPSASSKIYELWVLTSILNFLARKYGVKISVSEYRDLYVKFNVGGIALDYNIPREWSFFEKLSGRKIHLRPDYILQGSKGSIVYDAKYKSRIYRGDIQTMLTYIVEYAKPVEIKGEKKLLGVFYKLASNPEKPGRPRSGIRNTEIPVKIEVYVYPLDPRMSSDKRDENIWKSIEPFLSH